MDGMKCCQHWTGKRELWCDFCATGSGEYCRGPKSPRELEKDDHRPKRYQEMLGIRWLDGRPAARGYYPWPDALNTPPEQRHQEDDKEKDRWKAFVANTILHQEPACRQQIHVPRHDTLRPEDPMPANRIVAGCLLFATGVLFGLLIAALFGVNLFSLAEGWLSVTRSAAP